MKIYVRTLIYFRQHPCFSKKASGLVLQFFSLPPLFLLLHFLPPFFFFLKRNSFLQKIEEHVIQGFKRVKVNQKILKTLNPSSYMFLSFLWFSLPQILPQFLFLIQVQQKNSPNTWEHDSALSTQHPGLIPSKTPQT